MCEITFTDSGSVINNNDNEIVKRYQYDFDLKEIQHRRNQANMGLSEQNLTRLEFARKHNR
jgi:hypothetical protein